MNKGGRVKSSERNIKSFPHSTLLPRAAPPHTHTHTGISISAPIASHLYSSTQIQPPQPITEQRRDPLLPSSCPQPMISSPSVDPAHFWCLCCVCPRSLGFLAIIALSFHHTASNSSFYLAKHVLGVLVLAVCSDKCWFFFFCQSPSYKTSLFTCRTISPSSNNPDSSHASTIIIIIIIWLADWIYKTT